MAKWHYCGDVDLMNAEALARDACLFQAREQQCVAGRLYLQARMLMGMGD